MKKPQRKETADDWRVERVPGDKVRLTEAGRVALPLRVRRNDVIVASTVFVMTATDAASLYRELGHFLLPQPEPQEGVAP